MDAMSAADVTRLSAKATWYLFSEDGRPLGQLYRGLDAMVPEIGGDLTNGAEWYRAEIVGFEELQYACEMRRFRVVVRIVQ